MFIQVIIVFLFAWMFDQNIGTHGPICLKFRLGFNLKSDHVNLVAQANPIECLLFLPNVRATQYKRGPERLTQIGNSNVLRLPVKMNTRIFI